MARNTKLDHKRDGPRVRGLNLAALGPALVVIVYGLGNPPDAMLASGVMDVAPATLEIAGEASAGTTNVVLAQVAAAVQTDAVRVDASRECAPSDGVADACVYE